MVGFVGNVVGVTGRSVSGAKCVRRTAGRVMMTSAHGEKAQAAPAKDPERRPGAKKGFVEEMRFVAMQLHTKDQAPREGKQEESALPISEWKPKKEDYLQFLVDSKVVYDYMEGMVDGTDNEMLKKFQGTGLERSKALEEDIAWFVDQGFAVPEPTSAATKYVSYLEDLVDGRPSAFLCHWYNYYFAHTAGGRMIGRMMSNMLFDGREFKFYEWETDVKEILDGVRVTINDVAKEWPRDEKDDCLKETKLAFSYSGTVLGNLAKA